MPVRPAVCGSPAPMSAAEVERHRVNAVQLTNTRVATFAEIRDLAAKGFNDAGKAFDILNAPLMRDRHRPAAADIFALRKQLETFRLGREVSVQQVEQLPDSHKLVNGRVERVAGGQRVVGETLFFTTHPHGPRITAADALQQVKDLVAEVRLIASDNRIDLP